ncbi:MAG: hypothetical protein PHG11_06095 [Eubacteriales bacterium]|nr:hypothetical protein [Eubacteriales bacterium]
MNTPETTFGALEKARALLSNPTPLHQDCGHLCGASCCRGEGAENRGGMLLYPGEETLYVPLPEGFAITRDTSVMPEGRLLTCRGSCFREDRPLACRLFPLAVFLEEGGEPTLALDPRAWPVCPLMPSGMDGLSPEFVGAAAEAAQVLAGAPGTREFLIRQTAHIRWLHRPLWESGAVS